MKRIPFIILIVLSWIGMYTHSVQVWGQTTLPTETSLVAPPQKHTPLTFIQNKNQWDNSVKYRAAIPSGYLFAHQNFLQYSFYDATAIEHGHDHESNQQDNQKQKEMIDAHSFLIEFVGAQSNPEINASAVHPTKFNFFLGNDQNKWASEVNGYSELTYKELYPNTDLHLYLQNDKLKYDFVVKKGAKPSKIKMHYKYADNIRLQDGRLVIKTSVNEIIEQAPYSYQIINGEQVEVASRFIIRDENVVEFEFPQGYNTNYELIIDPELIFSTYSGSPVDNWGNTATFDEAGNAYAVGTAFNQGFPVTTGAFQTRFGGISDIAIIKYNPAGTGVFYITYLGGRDADVPSSCIVNSINELIILGTTGSNNFPTLEGSFDNSFNGGTSVSVSGQSFNNGSDIFLVKLNNNGSAITGSTYFGGNGNDGTNEFALNRHYGDGFRGEIIVDATNNIYIASNTRSTNLPLISAHRTTFQGNQEGLAAKFSADLSNLLWSTYIGGNSIDAAYGIQRSSTGDIYVVGGTQSTDLVTHAATIDATYGGDIDGFVVRYASNFAWQGASYIGTNGYDQAFYVDLDSENNVYAFGQTQGSHPVTPGVFFNNLGSQFIRKMTPNLNTISAATTIGSGSLQPNITPTAFMVNDCGNIYLAGWGGLVSTGGLNPIGLPTTPDRLGTSGFLRANSTGDDFYMMILSKDMRDLAFGAYIGGNGRDHVDGGTSRFDKRTGTIYQAVCACLDGNTFPTTPGVWSRTNNSDNCNNALFKIEMGVLDARFISANGTSGCAPFQANFTNQSVEGITYEWDFAGLGTSTEANPSFTFTEPGTYRVKLIARNLFLCLKEDSTFLTINVADKNFTVSNDTTICKGQSVQLNATGGTVYSWSPATGLSNPTIANPIATPNATTTYTLTVRNAAGCQERFSRTITVLDELIPSFTLSEIDPCISNPTVSFINTSQNATSYFWDFGNGQTSTLPNPPSIQYAAGTYIIKLVAINNVCNDRDSVTRQLVIPINNFTFSPDTTICGQQSVQLFATGGSNYTWSPSTGLNNPNISNPLASPSTTTTYTVTVTGNGGCIKTQQITVTVEEPIIPSFEIIPPDPCDENPLVEIRNTTTGATDYFWDFGNGQTSTSQNPPPIQYSSGTYTIKLVASSDACNASDSLAIEFTLPDNTFVFSPDASICFGQSTQLSAEGGVTYQWTPVTGLSNPDIANPIASPTQTTTYTVKVTGTGGCEVEKQITVEVGEEIIPSFDIIQENICNTNPTVRIVNTTTGATSYFWDFGNGQTSILQNPTGILYENSGTYQVKLVVNSRACSDTLIKEFDYFTNDFFVSPNQEICLGQSIQLNAGNGTSFLWSPETGLSNTTIANPIASPSETTTYTVTITAASGCIIEREVTVEVLPELKPDFEVRIVDRCDQLPLVEITNTSVGATSFRWDFGDGRTSTLRNPTPFTYSQAGIYTIKLYVENNLCSDSLSKEGNAIIDNRGTFLASIRMPDDQTICRSESVQLNVIGGEEFLWSPATGLSDPTVHNPIATPTETTTYNVRISNRDGGCFTDSTVTVTVVDKLELDFDVSHSSECGAPATILIRSNNSGNGDWIWDFGDGQNSTQVNPTEYTYTQAGTYTITVRASNGICDQEQTTSITVDNVLPPNVITPNGDGVNDTFVIDTANQGWKLQVYNRWGEQVFSSENYQNEWGRDAKPAVYHYYLTSPDGDTCRGWIQVLQ